jgi:hypothetical protein
MQHWNIKSRAHECARTGRAFTEKEVFHTAIYFDKASGEFQRRDIALDAWKEEIAERTPFSSWKSEYQPPGGEAKGKIEIASRESAENLMRRLIEEGEPETENARYILALMLERKKILVPKQVEHTEEGKIVLYENRKTGEVYIIRDPELRLDEMGMVQDEVAMLLGFGGPAAEAAAAVGMKITPEGKVVSAKETTVSDEPKPSESS